jgi:hypothetical protein
MEVASLSFFQEFSVDKYKEFTESYTSTSAVERRNLFSVLIIDNDIEESGNFHRAFIVDQLFLALEYSLERSFPYYTCAALLEIINEEFEEMMNKSSSLNTLSAEEKLNRMLTKMENKVSFCLSYLLNIFTLSFLRLDNKIWRKS